jgi:hypothetical protein
VRYAEGMRDPDGDGLTTDQRARRKRVRLAAAEWSEEGQRPEGGDLVSGDSDVGKLVAAGLAAGGGVRYLSCRGVHREAQRPREALTCYL